MTDPTRWNKQLSIRLEHAIEQVMAEMGDEDVDFPWITHAVHARMANAAVAVLEAVAYNEMWLEQMGGLSKDWTP